MLLRQEARDLHSLASAIRSVRHRLQEAATEKLIYLHRVLLTRW